METIHGPAMLEASDLTAKQLEEAINIVEAEFGSDPGGRNDVLVAAVLARRRADVPSPHYASQT